MTALQVDLGGGCKPQYHPNIDSFPHQEVDVVHDLTRGIPLKDGEADLLYSRDFVEHLSITQFIRLLSECRRVLKDGGKLHFICPDCERTACNHHELNRHVYHMFIGAWDDARPEMRHRAWFTPELMTYILEKEGWKDIRTEKYMIDPDEWKEPKFKTWATK